MCIIIICRLLTEVVELIVVMELMEVHRGGFGTHTY